uniref:Uncharacterized protein n=1 Tax=Avena sativa TaxID=4498 RepID=A0ACD5ZZ92_AVESA
MASPSPSFLAQLVRYVSSLPSHFMRATTRELPLPREGAGGVIRPLSAPTPKPPGPPAEGPGGHGGIIHGASPHPCELMRVAPQRPGTPSEGKGGRGGIIHAASS